MPAAPCRRRSVLGVLLGAAALAVVPAGRRSVAESGRAEAPTVVAAADLTFALEEIAAAFRTETGLPVRLTLGSSGTLARQIRRGAPFEVYLSADEGYVLDLARDGLTRGAGTLYAVGRIVLITPHGSPLQPDGSLGDLEAALADGRVRRFAIANPEHAPYGRRAEEALRHKGLWDAIAPRLVFGENVAQAAQFATSADAEGGIVAHSLALSPPVAARSRFGLIPEHWHAPLRQRMVLLAGAGPVAERFYAFVRQPAARAVLRRYGFAAPAEAP